MKTAFRVCAVALVVALTTPSVRAQEPPKPGPEHEMLKKMEGNWDLVMKFGGMETKGTVVYKMELGGLWLAGSLESELFGTKFQGKSLDTYDAGKKKFIGVWVDSMCTQPMILGGHLRQGEEDADDERRRAGHGRQADEVQVGDHLSQRRHDRLRHVRRRREGPGVHDRLQAEEARMS